MGRKPGYIKPKKESLIEEASREIAEDLFEMFGDEENAELTLEDLEKMTNFSDKEMIWVYSHAKALAEGKEIPIDSYAKHLVKRRMMANALDWMRFLGIANYFFDDIEEIIPLGAVFMAINLHVTKNPQVANYFASAIEQGMTENLKRTGIEGYEVQVPVITRFPPEKVLKAGTEILGKAFQKFQERVETEEKKKNPSSSLNAKTPSDIARIEKEKKDQYASHQ